MKLIIYLQVVFILIAACTKQHSDIELALKLAGKNRAELEKVISHYKTNPSDSLKLKAAYFLIGNMPGKYYYEGELLDHFYEVIKGAEGTLVLDSLTRLYGQFSLDRVNKKFDVEELKAQFLINNIDQAFKVWHEQPWGKNINFHQFCEYILPYRIDNEIPDYDRLSIYKQYNGLLDSIRFNGGDAIKACFTINNQLIKEKWTLNHDGAFLPHFSASKLIKQNKGTCRDMVGKTVFIMRALGIPVAIEFTPNWANRNSGHTWNIVLDKYGKNHEFMGTESNSGKQKDNVTKCAGAFRNTFARQNCFNCLLKEGINNVPSLFRNEHIIDVNREKDGISEITILLNNNAINKQHFAYLCVFDNVSWVPIHFDAITDNKVIFKNIKKDIAYLPAYYNDGRIIPANSPFVLSKEGKIQNLICDKNQKQKLILTRKYPEFINTAYKVRMKGGKFQAANNQDFKNAITFYTVTGETNMIWYDIPVKINQRYQYFRYLSPDDGWGNVSEVEFYNNSKKISGKIIGTPGSYNNNPTGTYANAMDGDAVTFFDYNKANGGWVGLNCNIPVEIDKIRFLPRNDDNGIDIGQTYELEYWDDNHWISAGIQIAKANQLVYENVPTNALYILHNRTKGKEERIFTYSNNKQDWW